VHNVDILSNIDLKLLYAAHLKSNPLATLVVSERNTFRYLLFNNENRLCGWINEKTGVTKPVDIQNISDFKKLAFSGIQVLSPLVFNLMDGYEKKFPVMDFYLKNAKDQVINGYIPSEFQMMDVGKLEVLEEAERFVENP